MSAFRDRLANLGAILRRVIGAPDYERYVAHLRRCHPDAEPLSWDAFYSARLDARYNTPGSKCC